VLLLPSLSLLLLLPPLLPLLLLLLLLLLLRLCAQAPRRVAAAPSVQSAPRPPGAESRALQAALGHAHRHLAGLGVLPPEE
jgi:hypothetical protein